MARAGRARPTLRPVLERPAREAAAENAARLRGGQLVAGGTVAPLDSDTRRGGTPGVRTGALAAAIASPANWIVGEGGFRLRLPRDLEARGAGLNAGERG